nr:MAG TPA: hypothetical protein [Caudoviricetes sp.]
MTSQFCRNFTQYRRSDKVTTEHPKSFILLFVNHVNQRRKGV